MRASRPTALVGAGLLLVAPALAGTARAAGGDAARLEALHRAIQEGRERVAAYEKKEAGLFDALRAMDEAARALEEETERARQDADAAQKSLAQVQGRLQTVEQKLARTRRALALRAVALYKAGEVGPVELVFAAGTLRDRLARIQAMQLLLDHDHRLVEQHAAEKRELEAAQKSAAQAVKRRDQAVQRLDDRRRQLEDQRRAKRTLLAKVRGSKDREREALSELEASARALEAKLAQLERQSGGAGAASFALAEGQLPPPVPGRVLEGFGRVVDREYGTETFRKGVDFAVQPGEPVRAVAAGKVRYAGWFRGYGRIVILDHGGGYFTVSGHLDQISVHVGDTVAAGQPIGTAGDTGSLAGPQLYFEIRHGSEALDPSNWLQIGRAR